MELLRGGAKREGGALGWGAFGLCVCGVGGRKASVAGEEDERRMVVRTRRGARWTLEEESLVCGY